MKDNKITLENIIYVNNENEIPKITLEELFDANNWDNEEHLRMFLSQFKKNLLQSHLESCDKELCEICDKYSINEGKDDSHPFTLSADELEDIFRRSKIQK